ncbi:hypothetical protein [Promicromonospora iranensis]|uniref:hypothetical protein n=1 Tax=Promicromonospora iranensis TaxID=1105144 RepID=UPI0023A9AFDA|nr:hypothetical protein [Promicromonospora iranensis]
MITDDVTSVPRSRPAVLRRLTPVIVAWAVLYGSVRIYFALGNAPTFSPLPQDLMLYPYWGAVALCAAAGLAAVALRLTTGSRAVLAAAWAVTAAILVACPLVLLDIVGGLLAGLGIPIDLVSFASRAGMLSGALLLAAASLSYQREMRGGCQRCGRARPAVRDERTPRWAWWAAYLAVAGCLVRVAAQLSVGFGDIVDDAGVALVVFEAGFILAGTLLPLALVHRFGLIWPAWVLPLAGRRVPRWLVLGPGLLFGGMMTLYFGFGLAQMVGALVSGAAVYGDGVSSAGFLWTSVSAYLVWGAGLTVASVARFRATRPSCRTCGL